jgi:hypothetical protein
MRSKLQLIEFIIVLGIAGAARPALGQDWSVTPPPDGEVQANFDEALSPYGDWTDVEGTRVWRPSASAVGEDFQPYATNGQWVSSDYGWYFQSDYPWGWAPFHYGRWALDANYGWIWIPGTVWAPAWVDWRSGGGYIGWAPLPPIGWSVVVQPWRPYWCFVPAAHFAGNFWGHRLPVESIHYAYAATAPVHQAVAFGGARWYAGPPVAQVERLSAQPIQRITGGFTPPAPGRIQSVQLQPPRGAAGNAGPRPAAIHPTAPRPYQPPMSAPPSRGAPAPTPTSHPPSRGSYTPGRSEVRSYAQRSNDAGEGASRSPSAPNWSGSATQTPLQPYSARAGSPMSHGTFTSAGHGVSGGHGARH